MDELGADRERDVEGDVELLVDGERKGLRHALKRAGEHDRGAELADPAREAERPAAPSPPDASGRATRKNVRAGPAPSVRAAPVSARSTDSNAEIAARM